MAVDAGGEGGLGFPYWVAVRRRFEPNAPFFAPGNLERELLAKQILRNVIVPGNDCVQVTSINCDPGEQKLRFWGGRQKIGSVGMQVALDLTEDERHQIHYMEDAENWNVSCPIVGCGARLNSLDDFEDHYHARHTASCSVCSRVYPTSRLLSIHVSEAHDSFFQAKVARGFAMYECLVEGCGVKLKSYKSRQQHLIDKHKFPTSFEFFKKAQPSKKQRQKSHQRKQVNSKESKEIEMEVEGQIDDLVSAVSKLSTSDSSPSAVSFGRRHARGFSFLPRSVQRNKKHDSMQTDSVTPS